MTDEQRQYLSHLKPFTDGIPVPYRGEFTIEEFLRLQQGLTPQEMEDKWFIYFDEPHLFFHRSWTGLPVYRVEFNQGHESVHARAALWSSEQAESDPFSIEYQAEVLSFLVSGLLLGKPIPFPVPSNQSPAPPGLLQHHITGTAAAERIIAGRAKPWWQFWK